jgi:hypothetical protein
MERTDENKSTAGAQVRRFAAMDYGLNEDRYTELTDTFLRFRNTEEVSRVVSHFIETTEKAPTVAAVLNYKRELDSIPAEAGSLTRADQGCQDCYGSGWREAPERAKPGYPPPVERCQCRTVAA